MDDDGNLDVTSKGYYDPPQAWITLDRKTNNVINKIAHSDEEIVNDFILPNMLVETNDDLFDKHIHQSTIGQSPLTTYSDNYDVIDKAIIDKNPIIQEQNATNNNADIGDVLTATSNLPVEATVPDISSQENIEVDIMPEVDRNGQSVRRRQEPTCLFMDPSGKSYSSFKHRTMLQRKIKKQQLELTKRTVAITLLLRKIGRTKNMQFFQRAINMIFVSAQISVKKGIKEFGKRAISAMIKNFNN